MQVKFRSHIVWGKKGRLMGRDIRYMQVWRCTSRHSHTSDRMYHLILHCWYKQGLTSVIWDFCHSVNDIFTHLGCYVALNGQAVLGCLTLDDGTDRLSQNISNELQINIA